MTVIIPSYRAACIGPLNALSPEGFRCSVHVEITMFMPDGLDYDGKWFFFNGKRGYDRTWQKYGYEFS
jgi:hypothetical protein